MGKNQMREEKTEISLAFLLVCLLALPTTKARIFIVFRFIIEYSSLRDFGP
jgi:hypothetical protein